MGNTISSPRAEYATTSWPLDDRPFLVVQRRNFTLSYGRAFPDAQSAQRHVDQVASPDARVAIEQGPASWVGYALEKANPGSSCLHQEKERHPENFSRVVDYIGATRLGPSLGLLTHRELVAHIDWRSKATCAHR